jgi:hypothetical protein
MGDLRRDQHAFQRETLILTLKVFIGANKIGKTNLENKYTVTLFGM